MAAVPVGKSAELLSLNETTFTQSICGFGRLVTSFPLVMLRFVNCCPLSDAVAQDVKELMRTVLMGSGFAPSVVSTFTGGVPGLFNTHVKDAFGHREGIGTPSTSF